LEVMPGGGARRRRHREKLGYKFQTGRNSFPPRLGEVWREGKRGECRGKKKS